MSNAQDVLQTMITPAVLISATGTLIMSTSNRTARVTDRVRELAAAGVGTEHGERRAFFANQLELLGRRLRLLRSAMQALYTAMGSFVATSLVIAISDVVPWSRGWAAVVIALTGGCVLFAASLQLVRESHLAARSTFEELEHLRSTLAR